MGGAAGHSQRDAGACDFPVIQRPRCAMTAGSVSSDFTFRDLYRSLDQRKRPEDVARIILAVAGHALTPEAKRELGHAAKHAGAWSSMSQDFLRSYASVEQQLGVAQVLFAVAAPADP